MENNNLNNTMMYSSYDPNMMMGMPDPSFNTQQEDDYEYIDDDFDVRRVNSNTKAETDREAGVYVNGKRVQSRNSSKLQDDERSVKSKLSTT